MQKQSSNYNTITKSVTFSKYATEIDPSWMLQYVQEILAIFIQWAAL